MRETGEKRRVNFLSQAVVIYIFTKYTKSRDLVSQVPAFEVPKIPHFDSSKLATQY